MRNWKLVSNTESSAVYQYKGEDIETTFSIQKDSNTLTYREMSFVLKNNDLWLPQQEEKNEWLKHSCKYGHWQAETLMVLDEEDMQFMLSKFREHTKGERT